MGFRQPVRRSTHGRCATKGATGVSKCGVGPAAHHPGEDAVRRRRTGVGPDQYRLRPGLDDHRSVPVGLSAGARSAPPRRRMKIAHAARPAGQHSEFYPHLGCASCTTFMPSINALAGSRSHLRRGSMATSTLPAFMCCTKPAGLLRHACQVEHRCSSRLFGERRIARPASFATRPSPWTASTPVRITPNFCGASASRTPSPARRWSSVTNNFSLPSRHHLRALQKPLAGGTLLQVDQAASSDQAVLRHVGERGEDADLDNAVSVYVPRRHRQEAPRTWTASLYTLLQTLSVTLFEKMPHTSSTCGRRKQMQRSRK